MDARFDVVTASPVTEAVTFQLNWFGPADPAAIVSVFDRALDGTSEGLIAQFIRQRVPIHLGGMTDPFQPAEARHRVTNLVMQALRSRNYPVVLSTRSSLIVQSPYFEILRDQRNFVVQFSFSSLDDENARRIEPHSDRPSTLLKAMEMLSNAGVPVTCRWQPYVRNFSGSGEHFVGTVSSTGCRHIAVEHLKLPLERSHRLWHQLIAGVGRDLHAEYKLAGAMQDGRELVLPPALKVELLLQIRQLASERGMTFGAADNELQYLSTTECCCSGVDQFAGFENWFKHQIARAIRKSDGGPISYHLIANEWAPTGSIDRYLNSHSRLLNQTGQKGSLTEHILEKWNNPARPGSPAYFYGVQQCQGARSDGACATYNWDPALAATRYPGRCATTVTEQT